MSERARLEDSAVIASIAGNAGLAALGFGFALSTRSEAVLLDGIFSAIALAVSWMSLGVARLLRRPGNERYPFGYAMFEPGLNLAKGLLIAVVLAFASFSAIVALLTGGRSIAVSWALLYAVLATLVCGSLAWVTRDVARKTSSPLVKVDAKGWLVDTGLSLVIAMSFGLVLAVKGTRLEPLTPFADPVVVLLLAALSAAVPIRVIRQSLRDVLQSQPPDLHSQVQTVARRALRTLAHEDFCVRATRMGRVVYVQLYVLSARESLAQPSIAAQDMLRSRLYEELLQMYPDLAMDVVFTTDPQWIRRAVRAV